MYTHNFTFIFLLDVTPWEDIFTEWGWPITPYVGGVEQRRKPQPMFCATAKPWLHSHTSLNSFLDPEDVRSLSLGATSNFSKGKLLPWLEHQMTGQRNCLKGQRALRPKELETIYYSILFYYILFKSTRSYMAEYINNMIMSSPVPLLSSQMQVNTHSNLLCIHKTEN
jgi:hypothetical protein